MANTKESWERVGESWQDFGRQLKVQYGKLTDAEAREAREARSKLDEAATQLSDHVADALRSVKGLIKDPGTKQSMDRVILSMGEAISVTFEDAADEIRQHLPTAGVDQASNAPVDSKTP